MMRNLVRYGIAALCVTVLMGAKGCGGTSRAQELCEQTGGTWDDSDCPKSCWPPACGESLEQNCAPGCGKEDVCKCPSTKPFWMDGQGCWSQADCNKTCQGTATPCGVVTSCSKQDGCFRDQCYFPQTCIDRRWHTDWCTRTGSCYQDKQCYDYETCYDSYGVAYDCGSYYDCGYYYTCTETYDCGYWYDYSYDCSYYAACGPCKGTPDACSTFKDPQSCGGQAGCVWQ